MLEVEMVALVKEAEGEQMMVVVVDTEGGSIHIFGFPKDVFWESLDGLSMHSVFAPESFLAKEPKKKKEEHKEKNRKGERREAEPRESQFSEML